MAPLFKKLSRPSRRTILPKLLKLFPQQVCFYRPQIHLQEFIEFETLLFCQVFPAFQKAPTSFGQERRLFCLTQTFCLFWPNFIKSLSEFLHDMKAVKHVYRLWQMFGYDLQIRFPHIRTDDPDLSRKISFQLRHVGKKWAHGFLRAFFSNPKQTTCAGINLVNQRQIFVSFMPCDFINAQCGYGV